MNFVKGFEARLSLKNKKAAIVYGETPLLHLKMTLKGNQVICKPTDLLLFGVIPRDFRQKNPHPKSCRKDFGGRLPRKNPPLSTLNLQVIKPAVKETSHLIWRILSNKNLEIMVEHIKDKLHDLIAYAGPHIAHKDHEELHSYDISRRSPL